MSRIPAAARRELAAADIREPTLQDSYALCRRLNGEHGKTYYLATLLLPPAKRPSVHALYGFARYADDIVDDLSTGDSAGHASAAADERGARLDRFARTFRADLERGVSDDPVTRAVLDTITRYDLPHRHFVDFLTSMQMDLTTTRYATFEDLMGYMWGSAAVIGLQMLPVLGRRDDSVPWSALEPFAADLGVAFQLTNFLRDVGEDLDRGRVYLPQDSLARFGVDDERLARRRSDPAVRDLIAAEIDRTRAIYRRAEPGIELVHPSSQHCLRTALTLYSGILDEIERADYDVFSRRVHVGNGRRAAVALAGLGGAISARRGTRTRRTTARRRVRA